MDEGKGPDHKGTSPKCPAHRPPTRRQPWTSALWPNSGAGCIAAHAVNVAITPKPKESPKQIPGSRGERRGLVSGMIPAHAVNVVTIAGEQIEATWEKYRNDQNNTSHYPSGSKRD